MTIKIYNNDVIEFLKHNQQKFSFALYDPPYEIGFVGKKWDNSGIVFDPEYNKALYDAMLPGAFVACYGHARVFHRVMVALEDAGFVVHKSIMAWVYSSGQPQGAPNIIKNVDTKFAKEKYGGFCECQDATTTTQYGFGFLDDRFDSAGLDYQLCVACNKPRREILEEVQWSQSTGKKSIGGPGYGNNNVQVIAKPITKDAEVLKGYTYGLSSFKPMVEPIVLVQKPFEANDAVRTITKYGTGIVNVHDTTYTNRWPGNFVAVHEIGCEFDDTTSTWDCVDTCELHQEYLRDNSFYEKYVTVAYNQSDLNYDQVDRFAFQGKASQKERHLSGHNIHPTIKPIALNTYLGKLFLPPSEYGEATAFVPFSGSGSEPIGLIKAGWDNVVCVELDEEYAKYSSERIEKFTNRKCDLL